MTNEEKSRYIQKKLQEKIDKYNLPDKCEKIPTSNNFVEVKFNDDTKDLVDPVSEFYLCKKYLEYFIDNYAYFLDAKNKSISPLKLFDFQRKLVLPALKNDRFVIFRKSRQVGASVLTGLYALWMANFNIAQDILIVSKTRLDAQDFKAKAMVTYERLPFFLKTKPTKDGQNMTTLKLTNNSRIITRAQSPDAGRGGSWSLAILDEAAFMPHADDIWTSIYPAFSNTNGKCFIVSTSNGVGNLYHKMWIGAENGENDFTPVYIPWWLFPGRDNPWLEKIENKDQTWIEQQLGQQEVNKIKRDITKTTLKTGKADLYWKRLVKRFTDLKTEEALNYKGPKENKPWLKRQLDNSKTYREFAQEVLAEFLGSGNTVLSAACLKQLEEQQKDPLRIDSLVEDGEKIKGLQIFEDPQQQITYTMTVDVASGAGEDYSTFQIFRDDTLEQVAEYKQQLDTKAFGKLIKQVARRYNTAYVIIETNQGQSVFNEVFEHDTDQYHNVYYEFKNKTYRGLHTSPGNKRLMLDEFIHCLENNHIIVYGKRTVEELKVYIWSKGKPQASIGYNDDLVLPLMFLAYLLKYGNQRMQVLGFAHKDQTVRIEDEHNEADDFLEYRRKQEIKNKVEEEYGVDWETYQMLVQ
jgi:hypothetical protein